MLLRYLNEYGLAEAHCFGKSLKLHGEKNTIKLNGTEFFLSCLVSENQIASVIYLL